MPRHHYLPASYLSLFSLDRITTPMRDRMLIIGDLREGTLFSDSASDVGCIKNYYTLFDQKAPPELIETIWSRYETTLPSSVEQLIEGTLDAETWARILVPFVTGLLLRGPDFEKRFNIRLNALGIEPVSKDNTNSARLLEFQRLLTPVIAAKWLVIRINGDENLITNDLGYAPYSNPSTGDLGIAIPLGLRHILAISPLMSRIIVKNDMGRWMPVIEYVDEPPNNQNGLNKALVSAAQRFIFGPDEASITRHLSSLPKQHHILEPAFLGFITDPLARAYEFTWHRLVSFLRKHPNDKSAQDFSIDWNIVANGWHPVVILPTNLVEFPSTLRRDGKDIKVEFYDPKIYYLISEILNLQEMGELQLAIDKATDVLPYATKREHKYRILIARSEAYADLGNLNAALKDCLDAIKLYPKRPAAHTDKGYILKKAERINDAISSFTRAIRFDPSFGPAYLNRGSSLFELNRIDDAIDDFSLALKFLPEGPAKAAALYMRGNILLQKDCYKKAIIDFTAALQLYPDSLEKANCLFQRALAYDSNVDTTNAINDLSEAIVLTPNYFKALYLRALLYMKIDKCQEAIRDLENALPLVPDTSAKVDVFRTTAICLSELRMFQDANTYFNLAFELADDKGSVSYDKGVSLLLQGHVSQAIDAFEFSLINNPDDYRVLNNIGICNALQNKHDQAIIYFDRAVSVPGEKPDIASAYRNKAMSLALIENLEAAEDALLSAESIAPDRIETIIARGRMYWFRGEYLKSLETHLRVQDISTPPIINSFTIISLLSLSDFDKANSILQEWLSHKPYPLACLTFIADLMFMMRKSSESKRIEGMIAIVNRYLDA